VRDDKFARYTRMHTNVHPQTLQNNCNKRRFMTEYVYDYYYTGHPSRVANIRTDQ
jgi:hypothetical protein